MTQIKWIFENMKGSRWKFYLGLIMHNCLCMPLVILGPMVITEFVDQVFTNGDTSKLSEMISTGLFDDEAVRGLMERSLRSGKTAVTSMLMSVLYSRRG